jgi:alkylation response protein AidB-like acyl-CoA dehydrogenase
MDFQLPADDDPRRLEIREWLAAHPNPTGRQLAEAGYVVPHWPAPWGLGADPIHQIIIDDELHRAKVRRPVNPIGIGWAGPTHPLRRHRGAEAALPPCRCCPATSSGASCSASPVAAAIWPTSAPERCATATSSW